MLLFEAYDKGIPVLDGRRETLAASHQGRLQGHCTGAPLGLEAVRTN